jgi:hypothetical protein
VNASSLEELLAEVAEVKRVEAQQRTDEVLAALMAGDPPQCAPLDLAQGPEIP